MSGRPTLPPTEASILEILDDRAERCPDRQIFCFLDDGEFERESLTYRQLQRRAQAIAAELNKCAAPGDRALILYPPGLEVIAALFGCFYAGVTAVPCCPPRLDFLEDGFAPLAGIAGNCDPAAVLAGGPAADLMRTACADRPEFARCTLLATETISDAAAEDFQPTAVGRDTLAVLQYTSGSTGDPKGVMITQGNILHNSYAMQLALDHRTAEPPPPGARWEAVCWLPYYHDMGLIADIIQPVYADGPSYWFSPFILLQRPIRWLEMIARYRVHTSGGPNFAYDLCVRRITEDQKATLDLSSWNVAAIGAEPISHRTMDRFTDAFACCGFRREAFYPCYGLAEATLFVSGGDKRNAPIMSSFRTADLELKSNSLGEEEFAPDIAGDDAGEGARDADQAQILVGCGHAWTDHEIVIVAPDSGCECPAGAVGEIWVAGPSIAAGYWGRDQETADVFSAVLSDSGRGPFLRTGDLGIIIEGELFVCGRIKDLIVIRGQNHYPQDIEATVQSVHEAFLPNSGAAVSELRLGEERLILLQEIDRRSRQVDPAALARDVRRRVAERHQLQVHELVFLQKGSLPKTTSGKIRRREALERFRAGRLVPWKPKVRP
ncbi:MAG: fatty acyl-AMP ligase [Planctomycetaceae bacterium]